MFQIELAVKEETEFRETDLCSLCYLLFMFPHGVYKIGEDGEGTIQFDEIGAKRLIQILKKEFGLS